MDSTSSQMKIKKIAAGLGIIQGVAWAIMSLICIILYIKGDDPIEPSSYMEYVGTCIYTIYMSTSLKLFPGQILDGGYFHFFMWIYFLENLLWIFASIDLLRKSDRKTLKEWTFMMLLICTWDFINFTIFGLDYNACLRSIRSPGQTVSATLQLEGICANGILPVFVIAAKGFTLWIFNILLAIVVFQISKQLPKGDSAGVPKGIIFFFKFVCRVK